MSIIPVYTEKVGLLEETAAQATVNILLSGFSDEPDMHNFPTQFDPATIGIWEDVLTSRRYNDYLAKDPEPDEKEKWFTAVELFLLSCDKLGVDPYAVTKRPTSNASIRSWLWQKRVRISKFLNRLELFTIAQPRSTEKSYITLEENKNTTSLTVSLDLRLNMGWDWDALEKLIKAHPFWMSPRTSRKGRKLTKVIDAYTFVNIIRMSGKACTVQVEFKIPHVMFYNKGVDSEEDRIKFVMRDIWEPLTKQFAYKNLHRRFRF